MTVALKEFTGGSLGDHDVVGDDLIAAMGITEALGGEADQFLAFPSIVLTKRTDGTFEGTGNSNMVGTLGPCSAALIETGSIGLTATQATPAGGTTKGEWSVVSEQIPSNSDVKFSCEGQTVGVVLTPLGYAYEFVKDLGTMTVSADGGTLSLHKDGRLGALDATVVITVITDNG